MIRVKYIVTCLVLMALTMVLRAQEQGETMVYLEHSESLNFDQKRLPDAQILVGNVCFRHDDALMYCDSAYFYEKSNSLDAFGHVRMVQGDTLSGYGDVLYYDGNTRMARLRRNVKLINKDVTLYTDSLNYDRKRDIAYYFAGGKIVDRENTLTSRWGQYLPSNKVATFRRNVHLVNDKFVLNADTLKYNTETLIAYLVGPTEIVYEKETTINSTKGWYNTDTERSLLLNRSQVIHTDGRSMTADSIYYDKKLGYGQLIGRMELIDSTQMATLYGEYGEAYEEQDTIGSHGFATDSALLVDWSDKEHYAYTHADTLFSEQVHFQAMNEDSVMVDSSYSRVRAYYGVRVYRDDMQMICDSLVYNDRDSIMTLFYKPVCWSDSNQMSADIVYVYLKNNTVDYMHGVGNGMMVKQEDEDYFDQLSGKEITAYIRDEELREVMVSGNAETVFYPTEDDGSFVGVNVTQSSHVRMFIEDKKIHHILFTTETTGTLFPMDQVPEEKRKLMNFFWADEVRPNMPGDVFRRVKLE